MAVSTDKLSQAFSLALEVRSQETSDLVTNSNILLKTLKGKGAFKSYDGGPTIRYRQNYAQTASVKWYDGYDFLNPTPGDYFQDAEFTPKMLAVSATLSMEEILQNSGRNQLMDVFDAVIKVAQGEMRDEFDRALHGTGTGNGGKEIVGLQGAIPTANTTGTYGSISRSNTWWRTNLVDVHTYVAGTTQFNSTSARMLYETVIIDTSRGRDGPDLLLADKTHFQAFSAGISGIQRITEDEGGDSTWGFMSLNFAGAGRKLKVVLDGGIGTNMPAGVTYFIDTNGMEVRYHAQRNFTAFGGKQTPINQDAVVQHLGWMGELCMHKPLHQTKLYDSNTGS